MILRLSKPRMSGEDVIWVQNRLIAHGFAPGAVDGIYGVKTEKAVKEFQKKNELDPDGIVCADTRAALAMTVGFETEPSVKERFLAYLRAQLGSIYVWGAQGETVSNTAWIYAKETTQYNGARAVALYEKRLAEGVDPIVAYDCSGLIVRFLLDNKLIPYDISSRGLYGRCKALTREQLQPGDLVFRHNHVRIYHVGVYMGDGKVIESKGRDDGVVERDIDASGANYWNRFGYLPELEG